MCGKRNPPENEALAARVDLAHRDRSVLGHHHEGAIANPLWIESRSVHEIVDEKGDLADVLPPPERLTGFPELGGEECSSLQQPEGILQRGRDHPPRCCLYVASVEGDVPELFEEALVETTVRQKVDRFVTRGRKHDAAVAPGMPDESGIPGEPGKTNTLPDPLRDGLRRHLGRSDAPFAATRDGLNLKRCHPDHVGMLEKEADQHR